MAKRDMGIEDYPSNSIMPKNMPGEKVERQTGKIIKGKVVQREKPLLMKWFGGSTENLGTYILWDILVPAAKDIISEIVDNTKDMMLYGTRERSRYIRRDRGRSYVNYNSIYDRKERARSTLRSKRSRHNFDDIIFEYRQDAEDVLSNLVELIDMYDVATVADFYRAVDIDAEEWNDNKFGWTSLGSSEVRKVREGYILRLPRPEPLD